MPGAVALLNAARAGRIVGWRYAYPAYSPCGLPLIYSPCWLKLPVLAISKPPVALPLTGATALCDLVARRRRNAPRPGKPLKKVANR
ncbi:hypothetical protein FYL58_08080 [Klebsiella aerogenes]|nr:hypothetical protein [Klebsiella aerogenes]EIW9497528.1 hypothetical protein [Klebsiella aerogenes]